jgi:outer membrane lipoprotein-sorting protein
MRRCASVRYPIVLVSIAIFAFAFAASHASFARTSQPSISDVTKSVEARYHSSRTLKAVFLERYNEGRLTTRVESGTAYFSRPGRMRWEYESPEEKLFLTDGKTTWFYVPADHTVSRISMKESSDWRTPLALITGKANLNKYCKHLEFGDPPHDNPANVILRCTPAGTSGFRKKTNANAAAQDDQALSPESVAQIQLVLLEVDPRTGWLAGVTIRQAGGVQMEYRFGRWEANSDVPESKFHFVAPKGVAIVNGDAPSAPSH